MLWHVSGTQDSLAALKRSGEWTTLAHAMSPCALTSR